MYKLKCTDFPWDKFNLTTGAYRLGSARDNEIVLEDPSVAAHHCEIVVTGSTITLRDLSPNNETFVNEQQVQYTGLKLGDVLRLGTMKLALEMEGEGAAAAETSAPSRQTQVAVKRGGIDWAGVAKTAALYGLLLAGIGAIFMLILTRWSSSGRESQPKAKAPTAKASNTKAGAAKAADEDADPAPVEEPREKFNPKESKRSPNLDVNAAQAEIRAKNYARAEPFLQRALQNQRTSLGPGHPDVIPTLSTLGNVYRNLGQYADAEPFLELALTNVQKFRGPEHPETAAALNSLGELQLANGQVTKAAPLLDHALAIREKELDPDDQELGETLHNVAALKSAQGDYAKAKPLLERAKNIFEKTLKPNDPKVAQSLDNLGELYRAMGEPAKAEPLLQRSLKLKERTLRKNDPSIARTLNTLAAVHAAKKEFAKAEPLAQRAQQIAEQTFGPGHPNTATSLNNLAGLEQKLGRAAKAVPHYQRAAKINEQVLGPDHPRTVSSAEKAAGIQACQGDPTNGVSQARQALRAKQRLLTSLIWYGSSQQRLAYRNLANPYTVAASLHDAPELALAVLRYKGIALDSLLEERLLDQAARKPESRELIDKLRATKDGLAQLAFEVPKDLSPKAQETRQSDMQTLATYLTMLQTGLERQVPGLGRPIQALSVNTDQVKWALPDQSALLELFRYTRCVGTDQRELCYGAVVFVLNAGPAWISLGPAEAIEKSIADCQNALQASEDGASLPAAPASGAEVRQPVTEAPNPGAAKTESRTAEIRIEEARALSQEPAAKLLRALHQQLWAPVEPLLPRGTKTVIISPDGALNLVSFATLLDSTNQFLGQKYSFRYVSAGRDLLGDKRVLRKGPMLIFGNPDFSAARSGAVPRAEGSSALFLAGDQQDLQTLQLPVLSEAAGQAAPLEVQIRKWDWPLSLYTGAEAGEMQLAVVNAPRILHLATRGFFLPENVSDAGADERVDSVTIEPFDEPTLASPPAPGSLMPESARLFAGPKVQRNPLHRSGLALTGGQATLKAWERGETPPPEDDGIVTAEELSTLKLEGTELVVLSNRETGTETARAGEGVLALRRAFLRAGAENLLITLWPVPDEETAKILEDFYDRFRTTGNAPQALADSQRDWLVRLRKERGLSAAVRLAGPYVMNSRGPLK